MALLYADCSTIHLVCNVCHQHLLQALHRKEQTIKWPSLRKAPLSLGHVPLPEVGSLIVVGETRVIIVYKYVE